jgi:hypothetical protein
MKKYVAIAPKEGEIEDYLTNGKEYPIIDYYKKGGYEIQDHFSIIDDDGNLCPYIIPKGSSHLNGLDWEIKEVEA